MKSPAEDRYHNAKLAGAGSFNREEWNALVKRASDHERERMDELRITRLNDSPRRLPRWDRQICGPDQIPIDLRTILAIEAYLAKCEMLHDKLVELSADQLYRCARRVSSCT